MGTQWILATPEGHWPLRKPQSYKETASTSPFLQRHHHLYHPGVCKEMEVCSFMSLEFKQICPLPCFSAVVSSSLQMHGLQHARLPCPSLYPGVCSNFCLLSQWCHPTISSSVAPFSSCPQSFPASGSVLHIRWPKHWSFSLSISPFNEYSGLISFRMDWLDLPAV